MEIIGLALIGISVIGIMSILVGMAFYVHFWFGMIVLLAFIGGIGSAFFDLADE